MQNELFRSVHKIVLKNKQNYILVYGFIVLLFFFFFFWILSMTSQMWWENTFLTSFWLFPHVNWHTLQWKKSTQAIGKHVKTEDDNLLEFG